MVDAISDLSGLARKLNQKSDVLNATITTINAKLAKLNLGIEVWIGVDEGDPFFRDDDEEQRYPLREETWLGYSKLGDEWQLTSKNVTTTADEEGSEFAKVLHGNVPHSLLRAPRNIRAAAVPFIPSLLDALKNKAEYILDAIDEAEKAAAKL